ncbi:MAG: adenylate/guanylate cyclase domain-containing protein, partial [Spirochaetota bacterium]
DKYEGDAIIAFFGAPLDLADHAARACQSAVSMKKMELELNRKFLSAGVAPSPLLTRVGLNTGDMVVGNMGTERKMDYTIIGDAVNLAARLEGVNKQYGTWVCASEDTARAAGDGFLFRRLDRIRVVGKSQPVRLFELVDERSQLPEDDLRFYREFEEALDVFESRNWPEAAKFFKALLKSRPEDGPSGIYIKRCLEYLKKPPVANWDGVYNLTSK